MKPQLSVLSFFLMAVFIQAQPNCEIYKFNGDTLAYKACNKVVLTMMKKRNQFSRSYQEMMDEALAIDSTFAYAYQAKSWAYLKSGDFLTWKRLIDKAVALEPKEYLGYRGWCKFQFFRDYKGALDDFESLDALIDYDLGPSSNGQYDLSMVRAICYEALGERDKAIHLAEELLNSESYFVGIFDYYHLGVWYFKSGQLNKAKIAFGKQENINDLAEIHYYKALIYKELGSKEEYKSELIISEEMYRENQVLFDPYTHIQDKVYFNEIEKEIQLSNLKD